MKVLGYTIIKTNKLNSLKNENQNLNKKIDILVNHPHTMRAEIIRTEESIKHQMEMAMRYFPPIKINGFSGIIKNVGL